MKNIITIRPYQMMCLICRLGAKDGLNYYFTDELDKLQKAIMNDQNQPFALCCNVESTFNFQNPGHDLDTPEGKLFNSRRDLSILQRLGLTPGGTYPALDLLRLFTREIKNCQDICGALSHAVEEWQGCRLAASGNYERGIKNAIEELAPMRSNAERTRCKQESAEKLYKQKILEIRPHHLLCITCFAAGKSIKDLQPLEEDHLYEVLDICQKNPDIPIKLIAGPCMICTPCFGFDPCSGMCSASFGMGLRDQKKDIDTLRLLGLKYGEVLPAAELFNLIFAKIKNITSVCGFMTAYKTGPAWSVCQGENNGRKYFKEARACGLNIPGVKYFCKG